MAFVLVSVTDIGGDVLEVVAVDVVSGAKFKARGWVSATTNYYPPAMYGPGGLLPATAVARAMTAAEIGAYARSLVVAQNPQLVLPTAAPPKPIAFV